MQTPLLIVLPCIVLAGVSGFILVPDAIGFALRVRSGLDVRSRMRGGMAPIRLVLEGGVSGLARLSGILLRLPSIEAASRRIADVLVDRGVQASPETACQASVAALAVVLVAGLLVTGSPEGALILTAGAVLLAAWRVHAAERHRRAALLGALPDALRALGVYYGSGLTLQQSFEQLGRDIDAPLGPLLGAVASDVRAGLRVGEALARLRTRGALRELSFASVAIEIHQRTGGSLQQLLDRAARDVADALALERELEVKTAQARLSAKVVSVMPVLVLLVLAAASPGYFASFLSSPMGLAMFLVACGLEVAGILAIRAILGSGRRSG